jgi:hypothetical protein
MTYDNARAAVLSHLRAHGNATNSVLAEIARGDTRYQALREDLILNDLAEDDNGVGLVYVGPDEAALPEEHLEGERPGPYDLFISYAHADDDQGTVTVLVDEIKARQRRIDGQPMRIFFDREGIRDMDDWEMRILTKLRESRVMIAMLSPAYFGSKYCRKEWEWFADHETESAVTGEAIAPIYTISVPGLAHLLTSSFRP